MPKKSIQPTRDRPRCHYGHDWRISFDGRFYYCFNCPAEWFSNDGTPPPQETYKSYPRYADWTTRLERQESQENQENQQGANTAMANTQRALDILDADPETNAGGTESDVEWKRLEDILYQPIVITRANIADKFDEYRQKNRTFAYVNFFFYDDEAQMPFAFRTAWPALRAQVAQLVKAKEDATKQRKPGENPFPVECGVVELLIDNPLVGDDGVARFPLKLAPFDLLEEMQLASSEYALNQNQSATTAPTAPPAKHAQPARA